MAHLIAVHFRDNLVRLFALPGHILAEEQQCRLKGLCCTCFDSSENLGQIRSTSGVMSVSFRDQLVQRNVIFPRQQCFSADARNGLAERFYIEGKRREGEGGFSK